MVALYTFIFTRVYAGGCLLQNISLNKYDYPKTQSESELFKFTGYAYFMIDENPITYYFNQKTAYPL